MGRRGAEDREVALLGLVQRGETSVVGSWVASGINNGSGGVVSSADTPNVTAVFAPDGELTGNDGCNDYFGTYEVDLGVASITRIEGVGGAEPACDRDERGRRGRHPRSSLRAPRAAGFR